MKKSLTFTVCVVCDNKQTKQNNNDNDSKKKRVKYGLFFVCVKEIVSNILKLNSYVDDDDVMCLYLVSGIFFFFTRVLIKISFMNMIFANI